MLSTATLGLLAPAVAHADATDIVISELMYHAPDPDGTEFIELYNRGGESVDISSWGFTAGITIATTDLKFPTGTTIPAGGRLVGTGDPTLFSNHYGFAADFSYSGTSLSNGGETVTLADGSGSTVASVPYDDEGLWPLTPDGGGPSLELINPAGSNSDPANWGASTVAYGTPGQRNSIENRPVLSVTNVGPSATRPAPNTTFSVMATTLPGASMSLTYKVMYGAEVTVPMADDAASPGGAGDGRYAATLPGASAGQLVRYRVSATRGGATATYPAAGDSRPFDGVVVGDPALASAEFPVLEWFMPDDVYADMVAHHRCDDVTALATLAWNGRVLDGGAMRIKGHHSCNDAEVKWSVDLPKGYTYDFGAPFPYALDQFALQSDSIPVPRIGWEMSGTAGQPALATQTFRVQKNAKFYSIAAILQNYDGTWRSATGYDNGALYKVQAGGMHTYPTAMELAASGDIEKKNPKDTDFTDVWQLTQVLAQPDSPAKRDWMYANLDLPEMTNVTALIVAMRQWDSVTKNFYVWRSNATGRWQILQWDLDDIFNAGADPKGGDFVTPPLRLNNLFISLFAVPDIAAMHYRRVRTLSDQFLKDNTLINRFDALTTCCTHDLAIDAAAWGTRSLSTFRSRMVRAVQERRDMIAKHTSASEIPPSQSVAPQVVIDELMYNPVIGSDGEYVELANPSATESVDMSGWVLDGPGTYTIPAGTVLLPGARMVFVKNNAVFRQTYPSRVLVGGQFSGSLDNTGETVSLKAGSRVVDTVTYGVDTPWPSAANGSGPSLELKSLASDNTDPASWVASQGNGTPGAANSSSGATSSVVMPFGSSWRYLATGGDQGTAWRASFFNDTAWPTGVGDLGFKNGNATTIPATTGRATYYFRTGVTVTPGSAVQKATFDLKRDDGAVLYINGVEVARSNMPTAAVTFTTLAASAVDGAAESAPVTVSVPATLLHEGFNTIAVEVHQRATQGAADLTMDGQLTLTR